MNFQMLLSYGNISESKWQKAYEEPENLPLLMQVYGGNYTKALSLLYGRYKIALFQKRVDDNLLELFFPTKAA